MSEVQMFPRHSYEHGGLTSYRNVVMASTDKAISALVARIQFRRELRAFKTPRPAILGVMAEPVKPSKVSKGEAKAIKAEVSKESKPKTAKKPKVAKPAPVAEPSGVWYTHLKFGRGQLVSKGEYVVVDFGGEYGEKRFTIDFANLFLTREV